MFTLHWISSPLSYSLSYMMPKSEHTRQMWRRASCCSSSWIHDSRRSSKSSYRQSWGVVVADSTSLSDIIITRHRIKLGKISSAAWDAHERGVSQLSNHWQKWLDWHLAVSRCLPTTSRDACPRRSNQSNNLRGCVLAAALLRAEVVAALAAQFHSYVFYCCCDGAHCAAPGRAAAIE